MPNSLVLSFFERLKKEMREEGRVPLLENGRAKEELGLWRRTWKESKKLWRIVGLAMIGRVALYGMCVITLAYAGHLGDLELSFITISTNVIVALNFGLMVYIDL